MQDEKIIDLFFQRSEEAINELDQKYGMIFRNLSFNILNNLFNINRPALFYLDILFILAVITIIYLIYKKHYPEATIGITTISTHFDSQYNIARHCLGLYFPIMAITLFINKHKKLKPLFYISFYILEMCLLYFWFDHKYFLV